MSVLLLAFLLPLASAQGLKVHISVDMEGIAGVASGDQLSPGSFEYEKFRGFMTGEALAAIEGARAAGATEIVVADSHGNAQNLLIDQFPPDVRVIRSFPRKLSMMAGIDKTFHAAVFIGYHASTNNVRGVRAHTMRSAYLTRLAINGKAMTEGSINAAIAGHFGVPVVMISGDDAAIEEVRSLVGPIEAAEVKTALGFHSASTMTPAAARDLIRARVTEALKKRASFQPYTLASPMSLELSYKHYMPAELAAYLPMIERVDSHSIRLRAKDILEASGWLTFLLEYSPATTP